MTALGTTREGGAVAEAVLDNIERVPKSDAQTFARKYLTAFRPVIVTDLFDGAPLAKIRTVEDARRMIGDVELDVQSNYIKAILAGGTHPEPRALRLSDFLDRLVARPGSDDVCIEKVTPNGLLELLPPPSFVGAEAADDLSSQTFLAGGGNFTHLHYDVDQRHVLMYQVFGSKRYVLIHPRETRKLDPMQEPDLQRCSAIALSALSRADLAAFLRYVNAYECVLQPGESLLMPLMAWHYVEYIDVSLSINYRLPRPRLNRLLADALVNPSIHVQRVVTELLERGDDVADQARAELEEAASSNGPERAFALEQTCRRLFRELCPEETEPFSLRAMAAWGRSPGARGEAVASDREITLSAGVEVLAPIGDDSRVFIVRDGHLETRIEAAHGSDWVNRVVISLASDQPATIETLALRASVSIEAVADLVEALVARGWVSAGVHQ